MISPQESSSSISGDRSAKKQRMTGKFSTIEPSHTKDVHGENSKIMKDASRAEDTSPDDASQEGVIEDLKRFMNKR